MVSLTTDVSDNVSIVFGIVAAVIWVLCIYLALRTFCLSDEEITRMRGGVEGEEKALLSNE